MKWNKLYKDLVLQLKGGVLEGPAEVECIQQKENISCGVYHRPSIALPPLTNQIVVYQSANAAATSRINAGVVPQHPPIISAPAALILRASAANSDGDCS